MTRGQIVEKIKEILNANGRLFTKECGYNGECFIMGGNDFDNAVKQLADLFDGLVVLTAEERDEEMKEYNRDRAEVEEQVRKDTAREILTQIKYLSKHRSREFTKWDGNKVKAVETELIDLDLYDFADEYGVEVEE